jgi:hypothetical protein
MSTPTRDQIVTLSLEFKRLRPHLTEETQIDVNMAILCLHSALNEAATRTTPQPRCQPADAELLRTLCGDPRQ